MTTLRERIEAALAEMEGAKCLLLAPGHGCLDLQELAEELGLRWGELALGDAVVIVTTTHEARVIDL